MSDSVPVASGVDFATARAVSLVLLIALLVVGLLAVLVIKAIVGKVLVVAVALLAAGFVFTQRAALADAVCRAHPSILGFSVNVPAEVQAQCSRVRS